MRTSFRAPFLRAEWRYLAMLNFEVEPSALLAYVPAGTELDSWNGRTYLSMVGFQFVNTRVNWRDLQPGSAEEFIAEHYWGCSTQPDGTTVEYQVEHPPWRVRTASKARLNCDVARLYGDAFVTLLPETPASAFLSEGSEVVVHKGTLLAR